MALQDFDMLLVSVVPHRAFCKFLRTSHAEMIPYLQMVHLCKIYQDDLDTLEELKQEQQNLSEQVGVNYQSKKLLAEYEKVTQKVIALDNKLQKRIE